MSAGLLAPDALAEVKAHARYALTNKLLRDRDPLPVPFKKGAILKYVGPATRHYKANDCGLVTWESKGFAGDLTQIHDIEGKPVFWNDDKEAPALLRTVDGVSGVMVNGGCVRVTEKNKHEWEVIG